MSYKTETNPRAELVIYATDDGVAQFYLRAEGGTVWLSQLELAELFQTTKQNVSLHIKNILADDELLAESVVKENLTTAADGKRYRTQLYNLDLILAVGYRVRSPRGIQFRQWASTHLKEFLIKGFAMDDERLKNPGGWDYFDELLERIRVIRASESRFYQKVRDLFSLSKDYQDNREATDLFFAEVQNKLLFAVTGKTAAEIIVDRSDPTQANMALKTWKAGRVGKADVIVAKNYLDLEEVDELNRLITMFLDFAEDRARRRQQITLDDWRQFTANFLALNERSLLKGGGGISREAMLKIAHERYERFDSQRRRAEALQADAEDMAELEAIEKQSAKGGKDVA